MPILRVCHDVLHVALLPFAIVALLGFAPMFAWLERFDTILHVGFGAMGILSFAGWLRHKRAHA